RLLQTAHVVATASEKEGWGLTVLEAGACGTPAGASDVPGLRGAGRGGGTGLPLRPPRPPGVAAPPPRLFAAPELRAPPRAGTRRRSTGTPSPARSPRSWTPRAGWRACRRARRPRRHEGAPPRAARRRARRRRLLRELPHVRREPRGRGLRALRHRAHAPRR